MEIMDDFDFVPTYNTSTAAPKYDIPERKPEPKTNTVKKQQAAASYNKTVLAMAVIGIAVVLLTMLSSVIYLNKQIVENKATISALGDQISQAKAENVRLNYELSSTISADKIQNYAVTVLGLQQAERYQIHYFEDRDGDEVVVAGGKTSNADT